MRITGFESLINGINEKAHGSMQIYNANLHSRIIAQHWIAQV